MIAADGQAIGQVAALFLDSWQVESLQVKLRKEIADQLGAAHGMFHAGTLELPVSMVQSTGDAVVLSVATLELRHVLSPAEEPSPAPAAFGK